MTVLNRVLTTNATAKHVPAARTGTAGGIHRGDVPRLFTIKYDSTKLKVSKPALREQFKQKLTLWGAVWPPTDGNPAGGVTLSNGVHYHRMDELEAYFDRTGTYEITWLEQEKA